MLGLWAASSAQQVPHDRRLLKLARTTRGSSSTQDQITLKRIKLSKVGRACLGYGRISPIHPGAMIPTIGTC